MEYSDDYFKEWIFERLEDKIKETAMVDIKRRISPMMKEIYVWFEGAKEELCEEFVTVECLERGKVRAELTTSVVFPLLPKALMPVPLRLTPQTNYKIGDIDFTVEPTHLMCACGITEEMVRYCKKQIIEDQLKLLVYAVNETLVKVHGKESESVGMFCHHCNKDIDPETEQLIYHHIEHPWPENKPHSPSIFPELKDLGHYFQRELIELGRMY